MDSLDSHVEISELIDKLGVRSGDKYLEHLNDLEINFLKDFDYLPDLIMLIRSYVVKKDFVHEIGPVHAIKDGITFSFHNFFEDNKVFDNSEAALIQETPHVTVFPLSLTQKIPFIKSTHKKHITIIISADYLKSYLREDAEQFTFLFDHGSDFLIEEIMTDELLSTATEILNNTDKPLPHYFYKLKAMELIFHFFKSLSKRKKINHISLISSEIKSVYKVRDSIVLSLRKPVSVAELTAIAGMNELKLRKIFIQVFGMGLYDYYQHVRMKEASRLLRDEKLTVSEAGYRLGFDNISHFSRVFEKHIGKKPKKYSRDFTTGKSKN
jgi:AraC-like DNA-binding protein